MKTKKAIVIGSSMAGMLAARVCANHFTEVLLLEKDKIKSVPAHRKGVPQDNHLHLLLAKGYTILQDYFPGIMEKLQKQGAIAGDIGKHLKWYCEGGYRPQCETAQRTIMMTRPLLENTVRMKLLENPKVKLVDQIKITDLLKENNRVVGVQTDTGAYHADLVIDATGFGSKLSARLESMGCQKPRVEQVKVNVRYSSCLFPRESHFQTLLNVSPNPPYNSKQGSIQPVESEKMIVLLQGRSNDTIPKSIEEFKAYTKDLETLDVYNEIKDLEPLSKVHSYHIPFVQWIHYEELKHFPEGVLPLGDAICRLNPVYGQGMSSAATQAQILDEILQQKGMNSIWKSYFKKVAKAIKTPWELTISEDFKFPETEGIPPKMPALLVRYFNKLNRVVNQEPEVFKSFVKVLNMVSEPTILLKPSIIWRVLRAK